MSVYDDIKKAMQELLAPDINEIKGEIKAINIRLDSAEKLAQSRHESIMRELAIDQKINALERRVEAQEKEAHQ